MSNDGVYGREGASQHTQGTVECAARLVGEQAHARTCQQVHEGGFASAIGPHNGHAAAHVNADIQVLEAKIIAARVFEVGVKELQQRGGWQLAGLGELKVHCVVGPALGLLCCLLLVSIGARPCLGLACLCLLRALDHLNGDK